MSTESSAVKFPCPSNHSFPAGSSDRAPDEASETETITETITLPPYHVVLLNDEDHSYEYVIEMLGRLFGHPPEKAYQMAIEVDRTGRVIVDTTHRERAELKQAQIHRYGPVHRLPPSKGSMRASVEPA